MFTRYKYDIFLFIVKRRSSMMIGKCNRKQITQRNNIYLIKYVCESDYLLNSYTGHSKEILRNIFSTCRL